MAESTETIVKWLREQGDLYEEQGMSTDAEYGHRFHITADALEQLTEQAVDMSDALHRLRAERITCWFCGADTDLDCHTNCIMHTAETIRIESAGDSEPGTCPECHDTKKTVINKHVGVEDCPVCAQTVPNTDA